MVVTNNNSVANLLASSMDGQVDLGRNPIVKHSRKIRKILTSTQRTWDHTWTTSFCTTFLELHVFCDASTTAYVAVAYVWGQMDDRVQTQMVTAKTRVAPIKTLCVPRLELCAVPLEAQLSQAVKEAINDGRFHNPKTFPWADSQVTLA